MRWVRLNGSGLFESWVTELLSADAEARCRLRIFQKKKPPESAPRALIRLAPDPNYEGSLRVGQSGIDTVGERAVLSVHDRSVGIYSRAKRSASPCWRNSAAYGLVKITAP